MAESSLQNARTLRALESLLAETKQQGFLTVFRLFLRINHLGSEAIGAVLEKSVGLIAIPGLPRPDQESLERELAYLNAKHRQSDLANAIISDMVRMYQTISNHGWQAESAYHIKAAQPQALLGLLDAWSSQIEFHKARLLELFVSGVASGTKHEMIVFLMRSMVTPRGGIWQPSASTPNTTPELRSRHLAAF